MANYYATARSNYFRVKDAEAFEKWCASRHLDCWSKNINAQERYAISPTGWVENGWPRWDVDEATDEDIEIDFESELAQHLDQDIAILIQVGWEKLRYLTGEAIAVNSEGRSVRVDLDEIYDKAASAFGSIVSITEATY